jgi:hypothetical protein
MAAKPATKTAAKGPKSESAASKGKTGPIGVSKSGGGETPIRTVRVPDKLWNSAKSHAKASGSTVSEVMTNALTRYTKG